MSTTTSADLKQARADLDALKAERPSFLQLLDHNEREAQRLRAERADAEAQAEARGRVSTARELLAELDGDIADAEVRVSALERQQEIEGAVRRIKKLESDLDKGRDNFADKALATYHRFLDDASNLRAERERLVAAEAETQQLREKIRNLHSLDRDLLPTEVRDLFQQLGIPRPLGLDHYPARSWSLRLFADSSSSHPVKSRLIGLLDALAADPLTHPTQLTLERKKEAHHV